MTKPKALASTWPSLAEVSGISLRYELRHIFKYTMVQGVHGNALAPDLPTAATATGLTLSDKECWAQLTTAHKKVWP